MIFLKNQNSINLNKKVSKNKTQIFYNYKYFIYLIIFTYFLYSIFLSNKEQNYEKELNYEKEQKLKLINENFFFIDSNNLENIVPHMYGYYISVDGIYTDNYYKQIGEYIEPGPQGVYIMIRKIGDELIINQDFYGSMGLYFYENKDDNYFALSNSFLLLVEELIGRQNISFNKDYADNLITTDLCSYSISETLIKEVNQISANSYLIINIKSKTVKIKSIDYEENTIPLESEKGLEIIDKWVDKWSFILRSLKKQTDNISIDLSGGFDTRTLLSIMLNTGIDLNEIYIHSYIDKLHDHDVDYNIATNISYKYGFQLNNKNLDNKNILLKARDSIIYTIYTKLGFHKEFYLKDKFFIKPRFSFTGSGGEALRGAPNIPIKLFIKSLSYRNIKGHSKEFYNSSERLFNRSILILKEENNLENDYQISYNLYYKGTGRNHFGKSALEDFISNIYSIQPLMDPDIKKIKFEINEESSKDLIAYIYVRFAHDLINFPFQGNRSLELKSIEKAEKLNLKKTPYKIKSNYNPNFYIDNKRVSPSIPSQKAENPHSFFYHLFKTTKYKKIINKIYDMNVYKWANKYMEEIKYQPLSQHFALLSIAKTFFLLSSNKTKLNNSFIF